MNGGGGFFAFLHTLRAPGNSFGNAVALTYTLEDSYGAKAVVAGRGFC